MTQLIGEFACKVDAKGRVRLPSKLLEQLVGENRFVVNRGFEKCLVLYPDTVWQKITDELSKLNMYMKQNRDFVRYFHRGATELLPDSAERVLLPKSLLEYAGIGDELVMAPMLDRIEIWAKEQYEAQLVEEPEDFSDLAESVMGKAFES